MSKRQAVQGFNLYYPYHSFVSEFTGRFDRVAYREAWGLYTDSMCRGGQISNHQYSNWTTPRARKN